MIMLRYPISLHRRSGFIFVKLIIMSENNFDRGRCGWRKMSRDHHRLIHSFLEKESSFMTTGKSMWINDIVICSGCLVISWSFCQIVHTLVILCVFLFLVWFGKWKLTALFEFHFGVGILGFSKGVNPWFWVKIWTLVFFIIFHVNKVRNDV